MSLVSEPNRRISPKSIDDVTASGTPTKFGALVAGASGRILVTAHPGNGAAIARVSGIAADGSAEVTTTHGQPLAAGASFLFDAANANMLSHVAESGSPVLCVTAV